MFFFDVIVLDVALTIAIVAAKEEEYPPYFISSHPVKLLDIALALAPVCIM